MNSGSGHLYPRLVLLGFTIWLAATLLLRLAGQRILSTDHWIFVISLFALSFAGIALLVRRVCQRARLPREKWLAGAVSILLPTLLLDPFSSAFFPIVFPNMSGSVAGVFGGWMIMCCAGGLMGALAWR